MVRLRARCNRCTVRTLLFVLSGVFYIDRHEIFVALTNTVSTVKSSLSLRTGSRLASLSAEI